MKKSKNGQKIIWLKNYFCNVKERFEYVIRTVGQNQKGVTPLRFFPRRRIHKQKNKFQNFFPQKLAKIAEISNFSYVVVVHGVTEL